MVCRDFPVTPSRAKGILGRVLKFVVYVHPYESMPGNIFGLIVKNIMVATGVFSMYWTLKVPISPLLLVLEVWHVKPTYRKS